jgi:hypothetical protein
MFQVLRVLQRTGQAELRHDGNSISNWGVVIDPAGDCNIQTEGEKLVITIPGGSVHTLSDFESTKRAPRVLQVVAGDFDVQVKVVSDFEPGTEAAEGVRERGRNSFNGAGLLVWDDENNFIRVERNIWVSSSGESFGYVPLLEHWRHNRIAFGSGGKRDNSGNSECTFLRMRRQGNRFDVAVSSNGISG